MSALLNSVLNAARSRSDTNESAASSASAPAGTSASSDIEDVNIGRTRSASGMSSTELRKRIREVQQDKDLEEKDKGLKIHELMTATYRISQDRKQKLKGLVKRTDSDTFSVCSSSSGAGGGWESDGSSVGNRSPCRHQNQRQPDVAAGHGSHACNHERSHGHNHDHDHAHEHFSHDHGHEHGHEHGHDHSEHGGCNHDHGGEACGGVETDAPFQSYFDESKNVLGCKHYMRGCLIKAPCCSFFFPCRFCHDEHPDTDHTIDRYAVDQVKCMKCGNEQGVSNECEACGHEFSKYFCEPCRFFDDHPDKNIYHCPHCNICRIGQGLGIDYFHCHKCNACMSITLRNHKCVERSLESNCPVCHEFMFTSTTPVMFLPCGHCMHVGCYEMYTATNYVCPICSKSLGDMESYFIRIDEMLEREKMPKEFDGVRSKIFCADCENRSVAPFHFLYHKCFHCASYNTKVLEQLPAGGSTDLDQAQALSTPVQRGDKERILAARAGNNRNKQDNEVVNLVDDDDDDEVKMDEN